MNPKEGAITLLFNTSKIHQILKSSHANDPNSIIESTQENIVRVWFLFFVESYTFVRSNRIGSEYIEQMCMKQIRYEQTYQQTRHFKTNFRVSPISMLYCWTPHITSNSNNINDDDNHIKNKISNVCRTFRLWFVSLLPPFFIGIIIRYFSFFSSYYYRSSWCSCCSAIHEPCTTLSRIWFVYEYIATNAAIIWLWRGVAMKKREGGKRPTLHRKRQQQKHQRDNNNKRKLYLLGLHCLYVNYM